MVGFLQWFGTSAGYWHGLMNSMASIMQPCKTNGLVMDNEIDFYLISQWCAAFIVAFWAIALYSLVARRTAKPDGSKGDQP